MSLTQANAAQFADLFNKMVLNVGQALLGKEQVIRLAVTTMLAEGHLLLEDAPGTGKTALARALAATIQGTHSRIQFTPDLLPSDITGVTIYDQRSGQWEFHKGPVFASIVLADEINRASPKTQSALLEVMEESQITVDGKTHSTGRPFMVIATQNPIEQAGTYPLPEAQLDRFLLKIDMGYPSHEEELEILSRYNAGVDLRDVSALQPVISAEELLEMRKMLPQVVADERILHYITGLIEGTRTSPLLDLGASPRASVALLRCAKAVALLAGRDFVIPDDVKAVAPAVLCHRLSLTPDAEMNGYTAARIVGALLESTEIPQ